MSKPSVRFEVDGPLDFIPLGAGRLVIDCNGGDWGSGVVITLDLNLRDSEDLENIRERFNTAMDEMIQSARDNDE